jgi:uncharacterized protein
VADRLRGVEAILHAGDVCTAEVLDELSVFAPVYAVLGNNDGPDVAAWGASPTWQQELGGVTIAMIHDSGVARGRAARLRQLFPQAALVIFGHSHIPLDETHDGQRIFNPGSPTDRRRQPRGTIGELVIEDATIVSAQVIGLT